MLTTAQSTSAAQKRYRYISTVEAYNLWSHVYDHDGNFLQALDTLRLHELLPSLLTSARTHKLDKPLNIVDLGCGTGCGIVLLYKALQALSQQGNIVGLDASPGMLEVCRRTIKEQTDIIANSHSAASDNYQPVKVQLGLYDMIQPPTVPIDLSAMFGKVDLIISTLVIEHIPLSSFFSTAARILRKGGLLVVTNMHSKMGYSTQAGFVDNSTGEIIRPKSYIHSIDEVVQAGTDAGFAIYDEPKEAEVEDEMVEALGSRAQKWVGKRVWFGVVFKMRNNI